MHHGFVIHRGVPKNVTPTNIKAVLYKYVLKKGYDEGVLPSLGKGAALYSGPQQESLQILST